MRKSRFTETKIVKAIKAHEGARKVDDICLELEVSRNTFYKWQSRYGGMEASDVKRLKDLEAEDWTDEYNHRRPHKALQNHTPDEWAKIKTIT